MNELGTRLKEARIAKGYSLEDLQDVTKIQKRYLAGIEEGNYSMMPGQFYVRAFIKQYADAVGLNADELLEQHKAEMPETAKEPASKPMATPSRRQSISRSSSSRINEKMPMVIVALFIVVILLVMWLFYYMATQNDSPAEETGTEDGLQYEAPSEDAPAAGEGEEAAEEEPAEEEPAEEPAEPETVITPAGTDGETTTYQWTGPAERELTINVTGRSWVAVTDINQADMIPPREMQAGESETLDLSGTPYVRIRLGATPNVELTLNGEPIEYVQELTTQNIVIEFTDAE
ncbi:RodZ domain-containing protein [Planococcus sp. CAU13]|uniref:helix-turn-helix domain-containing protein n=1 Tax=Planococcus sp. CAU13 TaxID=1541197 RepID=UPI00052FF4B5